MHKIDQRVIVEDLFLTDSFLIKWRLSNKYGRLGKMLEEFDDSMLQIEDATMVSLRSTEVIRTPRVMVNPKELILAHELVDFGGDSALQQLADTDKSIHIRAFYNGAVQLELSGKIEAQEYSPSHVSGRKYFTMETPVVRGLNTRSNPELKILEGLGYAIVRKDRMAYVYDFS